MASIFTRIVRGEIPAIKIYEDAETLAFLDIGPASRGHALVICKEEFELKPNKPGFANRCPDCTEAEATEAKKNQPMDSDERKNQREANEARRDAMRNLLYRKDS